MAQPVRLVVTGHTAAGEAIVCSDGLVKSTRIGVAGATFHEIWTTRETPARIEAAREADHERLTLLPPENGTRIRILDFPPDTPELLGLDATGAQARFSEAGAAQVSMHADGGGKHPMMHRTETIDYGLVLEGEIFLVLDDEEILLRAGDVVIQRGTSHAWSNRTGEPCRVAFVLVDGAYDGDLKNALGLTP